MSTEEPELSPRLGWIIAFVAMVVAAAPHAFFAPPLQLHMEGQMQAWLGIAVWPAAILCGVGFFFGIEFARRNDALDERISDQLRAVLLVALVIVYAVVAAMIDQPRWTGMRGLTPWTELETALPLFAALGLMRGVFWQGFVQERVMRSLTSAPRVALLALFEAVIVIPFLVHGDIDQVVLVLLPLAALEGLIAAILYESGYRVRSVMFVRGLFGVAMLWFQQAFLL